MRLLFLVCCVLALGCEDPPRRRQGPPRPEFHPERIPRRMEIEPSDEHYLDVVCQAFREVDTELSDQDRLVETARLALDRGGNAIRIATERWGTLGAVEMFVEVKALAHDRMELCGPFVAFLEGRAEEDDRFRKQARRRRAPEAASD